MHHGKNNWKNFTVNRSHSDFGMLAVEFIFNKTLYALSAIYYSAVIARSVTTKQSIK
jgi:cytochrome b